MPDRVKTRIRTIVFLLALCAAVWAIYGQVLRFGFVSIDDTIYVSENKMVSRGLTWDGIGWALTTRHAANWHPITWLSLMLDCQLFCGPDPGAVHRTNLLLHLANTLLLFTLWRTMTGAFWPSALVAALFAVHPLHVESVSWIAERKDVLSMFFGLLSLLSYVRYARRPNATAYAGALLFLGLGLGAKAILVTWPFVFLLLDFWPLNRWKTFRRPAAATASGQSQRSAPAVLAMEKLPFLAASIAASVLAFRAQQQGWAVISMEALPLDARVFNVLVNYAAYAAKTLFPHPLAVYYPYSAYGLSLWQIAGAIGLVAGVSCLALKYASARPYLLVGWCWYLGTLVPVVGLVQLASQAMADRYAYIPQIGLTVMLAWGAAEAVKHRPRLKKPLAAAMTAFVGLMMWQAHRQVGVWKDSLTLLTHANEAVSDNWPVQNKLGVELWQRGKIGEATALFRTALRLHPDFDQAHQNLGIVMAKKGKSRLAEFHLRRALALNPKSPTHHYNLGRFLYKRGSVPEAIGQFVSALNLDPSFAPALKAMRLLTEKNDPARFEKQRSGAGKDTNP